MSKNEIISNVLKEEIEILKSKLKLEDSGHLYTTISVLENRIEELKK